MLQQATLSGRIAAIDPNCRVLLIQDSTGPKQVTIMGDTEVIVDGKRVKDLNKIRAGKLAKAYFRPNHDLAWLVVSSS